MESVNAVQRGYTRKENEFEWMNEKSVETEEILDWRWQCTFEKPVGKG